MDGVIKTKVLSVKGPGYERLQNLLKALKPMEARVGWFESAKYPEGIQVAYVAAIQEFGDPGHNIPARPFMRPTIRKEQGNWALLVRYESGKLLSGEADLNYVLDRLGLQASGDIKVKITQITSPKLADATIAERKRKMADTKAEGNLTKPLVFTAYMLNSLTYQVTSR